MRTIEKMAIAAALLFAIMTLGSAAWAGEVLQGTCLKFDQTAKTLTVQNEIDQKEFVFDVSGAKIGLEPEPGNVLRIAYRQVDGKNVAFKVMNITKQSLRKE
ncbi:MAG: hypothetical protein AB1896_04040 [Thermodesulfobacteriota bacterium]